MQGGRQGKRMDFAADMRPRFTTSLLLLPARTEKLDDVNRFGTVIPDFSFYGGGVAPALGQLPSSGS